ncbi:hypothetical protein PR202_ga12117 [Eleusine coracana subsp. coracana]|uniref:Protein kinase domain-containing protein n=1 Tax=Eleusine coracana subsp. coracana TaxID=191504 RepID=A0AAV5CBG8_ELECO|nr:hypothetical protein PR202_ga12117 [Eleusine coracana subsp. coracana]
MDLKPTNILLDDDMVPKIADFGLSRLFGEDKTKTCTLNCHGTLGYMAPEYVEKGIITKKLDVFSLGVIIIEIITGHKDYPEPGETGTSSQEFLERVLNNWRTRLKASGFTVQEIDCLQMRRCIQIGLACVERDRFKRPTTHQIIKMLHISVIHQLIRCDS